MACSLWGICRVGIRSLESSEKARPGTEFVAKPDMVFVVVLSASAVCKLVHTFRGDTLVPAGKNHEGTFQAGFHTCQTGIAGEVDTDHPTSKDYQYQWDDKVIRTFRDGTRIPTGNTVQYKVQSGVHIGQPDTAGNRDIDRLLCKVRQELSVLLLT